MPSETTVLRPKVVAAFKDLHMLPVENDVGPGTPDLNYVGGWIELKHSKTFVKLDHYTPQQRIWAMKRRMAGGTVWFWWQIGNKHLIMDAVYALQFVNVLPLEELETYADYFGPFDKKEIRRCILRTQSGYYSTAEGAKKLKLGLRDALASQ